MAAVIYTLAAIAGVSGLMLWFIDSRNRRAARELSPGKPAQGASALETTAEQPVVGAQKPGGGRGVDQEDEQVDSSLAEYEDAYWESDNLAGEPASSPPEPEQGRSWFHFSGKKRGEQVTWVAAHGFHAVEQESLLDDEWTRGPAAHKNAHPRDVLEGEIEGYETYIADLAGSTIIAMRRGAASPVTVDMLRTELFDEHSEDDLIEIGDYEGFIISCSDPTATQSMIDSRVTHALNTMPEPVEGMWLEADWAVADMPKGTPPEIWEATFRPLALLADAARQLPPAPSAAQVLDEDELDLSRPMELSEVSLVEETHPEDPAVEEVDEDEIEVVEPAHPEVLRPEHPVGAPSRAQTANFGPVDPRPLGGDEVDPIADGEHQDSENDYQGTRAVRDLTVGASIFDDLSAELGDPHLDLELPDWDGLDTSVDAQEITEEVEVADKKAEVGDDDVQPQ